MADTPACYTKSLLSVIFHITLRLHADIFPLQSAERAVYPGFLVRDKPLVYCGQQPVLSSLLRFKRQFLICSFGKDDHTAESTLIRGARRIMERRGIQLYRCSRGNEKCFHLIRIVDVPFSDILLAAQKQDQIRRRDIDLELLWYSRAFNL